jgi:hypothetical protein
MFDQDTRRLVRIFQKVFNLSYVERDQVKYVKRYAWQIEWAGRLFQFLHLAKRDKRSPLGWRPTPLLLDLMNKRSTRKSKPSRKPIPMLNKLIVDLLQDAVIGDESYKVSGGVLGFRLRGSARAWTSARGSGRRHWRNAATATTFCRSLLRSPG